MLPLVYSSEFNIYREGRAKHYTVASSVSSLSSLSFIDSLSADKHALHDIRFRFKVDNIWSVIINNHPELKPNDFSKDISIDPLETHGLTIKTTIHHTDTVSVIVACSLNPVAVGLISIRDIKRYCPAEWK
jgi:hypothetical protein